MIPSDCCKTVLLSFHELQTISYKTNNIDFTSAICPQKEGLTWPSPIRMKIKFEPTCPHLKQARTASLRPSSLLFSFNRLPTDSTFSFSSSLEISDFSPCVWSTYTCDFPESTNRSKFTRAKQLNQYGMCTEPEMLYNHRLQCKQQSSLVKF